MKLSILSEYEKNLLLYNEMKTVFINLIEKLIIQNDIKVHTIDGRVKDRDSLDKKIEIKNNKYLDITEITDIVGIRIVTYYSDDVDRIADLITKEFIIDYENSIDKRQVDDPNKFGYLSLHYIASMNDKRTILSEYSKFKDIKAEIQIRSILQHTWASINHDLGYKSKIGIPKTIQREFSRLASLLELADEEFLRIRLNLDKYSEDIANSMDNKTLNFDIDSTSLHIFLNESNVVQNICNIVESKTPYRVSKNDTPNYESIILLLDSINIKTIDKLDHYFNKYQDAIEKIMVWSLLNSEELKPKTKKISKRSVAFYLFYTIIIITSEYEIFRGFLLHKLALQIEEDSIQDLFRKLRIVLGIDT